MKTKIGKIEKVVFGFGGYQDAMIGFTFTLGSDKDCWSVVDFRGWWHGERPLSAKWLELDRANLFCRDVLFVAKLLEDAGRSDLYALADTPIEATFDEMNVLKSWRILKEVL